MTDPDGPFVDPIDEDEDLLARLREAGELDQPPAELGQAIKAAFSMMTLDAELAQLTYDSSEDERALAGVRDAAEPSRFLSFEAPALTVEVEATPAGGGLRLVGQLSPPRQGQLEVRHDGGTTAVAVDEFGRFSAEGISPGPISLHCQATEGAVSVTTDWVIV